MFGNKKMVAWMRHRTGIERMPAEYTENEVNMKFKPKLTEAFMQNISTEVLCRVSDAVAHKKPITLDEYKDMRPNSYAQKFMSRYLDNEAFMWRISNRMMQIRDNGACYIPITYNEYLSTDGIRELTARFKHLLEENTTMYGALLDASNLGSARALSELQRIARNDNESFDELADKEF